MSHFVRIMRQLWKKLQIHDIAKNYFHHKYMWQYSYLWPSNAGDINVHRHGYVFLVILWIILIRSYSHWEKALHLYPRLYVTHWGPVTQISVNRLARHWFRRRLVASSAPSPHLDQYRLIVVWTLMNKLQRNLRQNTTIFIQGNAFKISSAKWWPFVSASMYSIPHSL